MEVVPEKSTVVIGSQTTAFFTCPDCEIIKLTEEDSPYRISMKTFKKKDSKSKIVLDNFFAAVKSFVYPDSKAGDLKAMSVRGDGKQAIGEKCSRRMPDDDSDIMALEEIIPFQWGISDGKFKFEIKNLLTGQSVFTTDTIRPALNLDASILNPGTVYMWQVLDKQNKTACDASFSYLSKAETQEIEALLEQVVAVLPSDANQETKTRLKAGYLLSEGLNFDAYRLLNSHKF